MVRFARRGAGRTIVLMQADPARSGPLRVVVIDADERIRESLAGLLCIGDHLRVVGDAGQTDPAIDIDPEAMRIGRLRSPSSSRAPGATAW